MKKIIYFLMLKVMEIGLFIFIPYLLGLLSKENNLFITWCIGWLIAGGILVLIAIGIVSLWILFCVSSLLFLLLLVWIDFNWKLVNKSECHGAAWIRKIWSKTKDIQKKLGFDIDFLFY